MIIVYLIMLLTLAAAGLIWDNPKEEEVFGSLTGRFDSQIKLSYNGDIVQYREFEVTNYLLLGVDRDELDVRGYQNGGQADFLLILSVDRRNRTVTPVMVDRDTMTPVTTYGVFGNEAGTRTMQICLSHAFSGVNVGSSENTCRAVSGLLGGVKIDRCLTMDMDGIVLLNDALGGVTVTLEDDMTLLDPALKKGATVKLTGETVEHFVRARRTVSDGTNASRMRRQRTYFDAMLKQLKAQAEEDDETLSKVLESLSGHMQSDTEKDVLLAEANASSTYEWKPIKTLPGNHRVGEDGFVEYWTDDSAMMDMIVELWFEK